jgi:hypothetical protein
MATTNDPTAVKAEKNPPKAPDHGDISDLKNTDPDPRIDNRRGAARPPLEDFPAKPQQVDGGDISDIPSNSKEVDEAVKEMNKTAEKLGKVKGAQSPGPVGLGEDVGGENTTGT